MAKIKVNELPDWAISQISIEKDDILKNLTESELLENIKNLLTSSEEQGELELFSLGGDDLAYHLFFSDEGGTSYSVRFDGGEKYPIGELGYNSEIGLHRLPLLTYKCEICGKELTTRDFPTLKKWESSSLTFDDSVSFEESLNDPGHKCKYILVNTER